MKKEHGDRLARALEFANESAEYHVRNNWLNSLIAVPLLPIAWKNSVLFSNSIMYLVLQWSMELSVNCVPMKIVLYVVKYTTIRRKC